jgi:glycolate oxidase iron-sulfur subunit
MPVSGPSEVLRDLYPGTLDCVHCGLCLPACPTYRITGRETSSPRGRLYLMRGAVEGEIPLGDAIVEEAYLCLGCRACETACPSGVEFGAILEEARAAVEEAGLRKGWRKRIESWALTALVPRPRRLHLLVGLLGGVQRLRLDRLAAPLLPASLREAAELAPVVPPASERTRLPSLIPARGKARGRVALFEGCIVPELFGRVNLATARVLARNGFEVLVPGEQGCCGALQAHSGEMGLARDLARRNLAAFDPEGVDAIVVNSAGCGAALRELERWLPGQAEAFAASVRDICEFLANAGIDPPPGRLDARVCYDDPCHLVHGQRVDAAPRRLLEMIPGLQLIDHDDPTACCGAAGIYNLTHGEMSREVLERKMGALAAADPDVIASGNPGCLIQLQAGARRWGLRARVVHPIELLAESYGELC